MKKILLLGAFAVVALLFACQKDSLSVMNNAPQDFYSTLEDRGHHPHDSTFVFDSTHHHHHDSLHMHFDSLHVHCDSLHVHGDSLHVHHDSTLVDTTGHHGPHGGGHGGHHGGHHGG